MRLSGMSHDGSLRAVSISLLHRGSDPTAELVPTVQVSTLHSCWSLTAQPTALSAKRPAATQRRSSAEPGSPARIFVHRPPTYPLPYRLPAFAGSRFHARPLLSGVPPRMVSRLPFDRFNGPAATTYGSYPKPRSAKRGLQSKDQLSPTQQGVTFVASSPFLPWAGSYSTG